MGNSDGAGVESRAPPRTPTLRLGRRLAAGWLALGLWMVAAAQDLPRADAKPAPMVASQVRNGLYLISGGGGNSLLRFSAAGLVLVDGQRPGDYKALMAQVGKLSKFAELPVRVLVLTDHHAEHSGTDAQFAAARIPIVAQARALRRLPGALSANGAIVPPFVGYERDYSIHLGGVDVELSHLGNAHTDGDTVVVFPDLKVVAVGNLFSAGTPVPDFANGGSLAGWGAVLERILKLDVDVVVPARGPVVGRAELEAFKARLDTLVERASALVKQGVAEEDLMARLRTDDPGWQFDFSGAPLHRFYAEVSPGR